MTDPELAGDYRRNHTGNVWEHQLSRTGKIAGAVTHVFVNDPDKGIWDFYRKYAETCRIIRILSMQVRFLRQHFLVRKLQEYI